MYGAFLLFGFLLGVKHALEADHVAAVAALATRGSSLRENVSLATAWGIGHTATLLLFGGLLLAFGVTLPPQASVVLEGVVGLVLVFLGADVIRRARRKRVHVHVHHHGDGPPHLHVHAHEGETHAAADHEHSHVHAGGLLSRAFMVGGIHGLAGSAAVVLLALTEPGPALQAVAFLGVFGLGTILGMVSFSLAIAIPLRFSAQRWKLAWGFESAVGAISIVLGGWLVLEMVRGV